MIDYKIGRQSRTNFSSARVEGQNHKANSDSNYDTSNILRGYWPKKIEEVPMSSVNPLGIAFGYVLSSGLRRAN